MNPVSRTRPARRAALVPAVCLALAGCVSVPPATPPTGVLPPQWHAPLPHGGDTAELGRWWQRLDDPPLAALIERAQAQNPGLAEAAARIAEARAVARAAGAVRWPALDARAGLTRSDSGVPSVAAGVGGPQTSGSLTLDASWELDLFGAARRQAEAAGERAEQALAGWHDARVSLAAEVAGAYLELRACEALVDVYRQDAESSRQTAGLTRQKIDAGFEAPANGSLAGAAAAEASNRLIAQESSCEVGIKQLVALAAEPEPAVRAALAPGRARLPRPAAFGVDSVPADVLAQRPDLAAAQRAIAAAAADVGVAEADRYPRLSLTGSIGRAGVRVGGQNLYGNTWSIGPSLVAPLFDAGRRRADADASRARYEAALAAWRSRALQAAREVEEALVRLDAGTRRESDAAVAAQGYAEFFTAAETQWQVGTGSLLDLEQARRNSLGARAGLVQVQRERVAAWLALYKAVGGGWGRDGVADPVVGVVPPEAVGPPIRSAGPVAGR